MQAGRLNEGAGFKPWALSVEKDSTPGAGHVGDVDDRTARQDAGPVAPVRPQMTVQEIGTNEDIAIDEDDQRCPGFANAGVAGGAAAPVGRKPHDLHRRTELLKYCSGLIGGPIVDHDDLVWILRQGLINQSAQALSQEIGLVVSGDNDAQVQGLLRVHGFMLPSLREHENASLVPCPRASPIFSRQRSSTADWWR